MTITEAAALMDAELRLADVPDYPPALNGLQLEAPGEIRRIAAAVDACEPVVARAAEAGANLLLVHHGMFWSGAQPVRGAQFRKLRSAIDAGLAIYSAHIPLDVHPSLGNNARLAAALGIPEPEPFFPWKGIDLGLRGRFAGTREDLAATLREALGGSGVHLCPGGGESAGVVGVITGGAGAEVAAIAGCGIDTFVTGEGPHWSYTAAEELGINVLYGGHYATETFGVKALAEWLSARCGAPWEFIDHPTGL